VIIFSWKFSTRFRICTFHAIKLPSSSRTAIQYWQIDYAVHLSLLLLVFSSNIPIPLVLATETRSTVTFDPGFGCGTKYWGVKNYQNKVSEDASIPTFGRLSTDCTDNLEAPAIPESSGGIRNYARLHAETLNPSDQSIAWQAAFQGADPWGVNATKDGQASVDNNLFPLSAQLNYTLDVSYLWLDDDNSRPQDVYDNLKGNILVDLWFAEDDNNNNNPLSNESNQQQPTSMLVIDLALANLENVNGRWRQDPFLWEGVQYYKPYAERKNNGQLVYYYNIVIDVDGKDPGVWYNLSSTQYPKSLDQIIYDAFSYNYAFNDGSHAPTIMRHNFNLVDIEAGAEVWNDIEASGELTASFSLCNLSYFQAEN
jgi:hypothetical protein